MSLWDEIKKRAEGVIAQITPDEFDGGKNFDTVVNNKPIVKPPVNRSPAVEVKPAKPAITSGNRPFGSQNSPFSFGKLMPGPSPTNPKPNPTPSPRYDMKQRDDKGFDFYKDNSKIDIDQYTRENNVDKTKLVQELASKGDPVSKAAIEKKAVMPPAKPNPGVLTVPGSKPLDIGLPKPKPAPAPPSTPKSQAMPNDDFTKPPTIQTRARTIQRGIDQKLSLDQISTNSGLTKDEIRQYTNQHAKGYGEDDIGTSAVKMVGDVIHAATGIVRKPITTVMTAYDKDTQHAINDALNALDRSYKSGVISEGKLREEVGKLIDDQIGHGIVVDKDGVRQAGSAEASKQALLGGFQQGVDTAGVLPAGRVLKGVQTAGGLTKPLVQDIIKTNAKQAGVYGATSTTNDVVQGRDVTPGSLAVNFGAPFALGSGSEMAGVVGKQVSKYVAGLPREIKNNALIKAADGSQPVNIPTNKLVMHESAPDRARIEEYKAHYQNGGNKDPLYVMRDSDGSLSVEDGKHRLTAMNELGITEAPAYVVTPERLKQALRDTREGGYAKIPGSRDAEPQPMRAENNVPQNDGIPNNPSTSIPALSKETSSPASIPNKAALAAEASRRGLIKPRQDKPELVAEAQERGLIPKAPSKKEILEKEATRRGLIERTATPEKAGLRAEAERRGLIDSNTPPTEVFGPEPTFPTVKRTAASEFYEGATKRSDLSEDINVADPASIREVIQAKQNKVGEQFAKPSEALRMSKGRADKVEEGTIVSESKSGNQRKRLFIRPDGQSTAVIETRNPDGSWVEMKEPAIAGRGDFRGIDALEGNDDLTAAAAKAMEDGKEIHMYAEKSTGDPSALSATVREFNPEKHIIDGGFVRDANNGAILGNHIKIDDTGIAINIGKEMVNMSSVTGDPAKWKNMNKATYTLDRILETAAPNKETYMKTRKFVIESKQAAEAKMRGDLSEFRTEINTWRKDLLKDKPIGVSKQEYMRDIFFYAERKLAQDPSIKGRKLNQEDILEAKYGPTTAEKIKNFDSWARGQYDTLLDRTNEVLRRFGHDEVPLRQNYMTHLQEDSLWDKIGIGEDLYRDLSSGIMGEANPSNRGQLPGTIAGKTEQFRPTKKYNPFHQTRRGTESMTDPFRAMDAYGEAALFNIHMTESAVRARSVESVFRAAEEIAQKDMIKVVNEDLRKSLKESMGGSRGDLVIAFQEYANALAGKSNQFDRKLQDGAGAAGRAALRVSRMLQKIASNSSIVGNVNVTLAQALNLPNTIGTNGVRSTIRGVSRMVSDIMPNGEPKPGSPASQSNFLKVRYTDAQSKINVTPLQKTNQAVSKALFMPQVERAFTELAWQSSYEKALSKGMKGLAAVKEADRMTERLVAGRGIGDQPDLYRSTIGRTFLQYTLEVNAALKNVRKDMTPAGVIKYAVAVFAINYGLKQLTGRAPLPDFIGATVDTAKDFADSKSYEDESAWDKTQQAAQKYASQAAGMSPVLSAMFNAFMTQDAKKTVFGEDSNLGRYDGSPAAAQVVSKLLQGLGDLANGEGGKAWDKALSAIPYGGQIRKTTGGISTMQEGVARDSEGNPTANVDTSNPFVWIQAALFGKNAIPEVTAYFNNKSSALGDKQTETFEKLKEAEGIESAKEYLAAVTQRREERKDKGKDDFADFAAEAKVKLSDGTWEERNGVVVYSDTGEVVRSYYKKIAKEASDSGDKSDKAYNAFVKGYDLKEMGAGKPAQTGDNTLDQLNKLSGINDQKDVIEQAISLLKKSNEGYENIPDWVTEKYLGKNKIDKGDALYAAKASYSNDTKLPVVMSDIKDMDHGKVLDYLATGRVESIKGGYWVTQGVLADLRDQGVISKDEYRYLNSLKLNKDGSEKAGSGASGRGGKKAKTVSADELRAANSTTDLEKALAKILKNAGKRQYAKKISYKRRK